MESIRTLQIYGIIMLALGIVLLIIGFFASIYVLVIGIILASGGAFTIFVKYFIKKK
jgi:uncharacterized membrane protein HdeD (DUF308 family)